MNDLFDIDIFYLKIGLLFILPAAINFGIFVYVLLFLSKHKTNLLFGVFVLLVCLWQITAGFNRVSNDAEAALNWFKISLLFLLLVMPFGMAFTMSFLNYKKKLIWEILLFGQLLPIAVFVFFIFGKSDTFIIQPSEQWHWIVSPNPSPVILLIYSWLCLSSLTVLIMLWQAYFNSKSNVVFHKQTYLLALGFSFPILIGIVTEALLPLIAGLRVVPLSASIFTVFSLNSLFAMKKYQLLDYSPKHQWGQIVESLNEGLIIVNNQLEIMFANQTFCNQMGYKFEELQGKKAGRLLIADEDSKKEFKRIMENRDSKKSDQSEIQLLTKLGETIWVLMSGSPYLDRANNRIGSIGIQTNITRRKKAEEKILKTNQLYAVLSHINQLIVHSESEELLLNEACKIITDYGKFNLAWIGIINNAENKISMLAESKAWPSDLEMIAGLNYEDSCPTYKVVKSGTHLVINNFENEPENSALKQYAQQRNFYSAIFLPLKKSDKTIGTFNLFSTEQNFLDQAEIELLVEISADISYALDVLEKEKQRKLVEEKLEYGKSRLKEAQAIARVGSWEMDFSTGIVIWSDEACRIFGLSPEETREYYESWVNFIHPEDLDYVLKTLKKTEHTLGDSDFYHRILRKDGTERHIYSKTKFDFDKDGKPIGLHGVVQDVTEAKNEEQNKEFQKNNLSALINNTNDLMWSTDRNMRLITANNAFTEQIKKQTGKHKSAGNYVIEGLKGEQLERWKKWYQRAFSGESFTTLEHTLFPYEKWAEISFYPIYKTGKVIGSACYSRNITDSKKAEAEIIKLNEDLENKIMERTIELAQANVMLKKEAQMLTSASKVIEAKNKDITDSLNYAKIIQNATVSKKGILVKYFPDSFLINMPLHVVSGDFVRVDEKDGTVFVALADCTGHGIPGALMSMIGYSFFNDVINYKRKTAPSVVLRSLDADFKHLTSEAVEMKDGMDVGFCSINIFNMELNYAGAHRPLYVVRDNELIEIKGDNLSVGGQSSEIKRFTNSRLKLKKGDSIYMFSDGYTDQFGGDKGKKLSSKRFKELLLSIQYQSMEEQGEFLKKFFIEWKGSLEQVDDICLLGIRI